MVAFAAVWRPVLLVLLMLLPAPAVGEAYRFEDAVDLDHRGQLGIRFEPGVMVLGKAALDGTGGWGLAAGLDLGASKGLAWCGNELSVRARLFQTGDGRGLAAIAGYRAYAGSQHWKTFADLDLMVPLAPAPAAGARLGMGLMYDPSRRLGFSLSVGAFAALGRGLVSGFDGGLGVQVRFD